MNYVEFVGVRYQDSDVYLSSCQNIFKKIEETASTKRDNKKGHFKPNRWFIKT